VASAPGTYGPTQRKDTLWRIANSVRPDDSVTVDQAMIALLKANPDAFIGRNINRLKAGYVLQVPDRATMTTISAAEARAEVRQQARAWRARTQPAASAAPATAGTTAPKGRLELLAPENKAAGAATADSGATGAADQTKQLALAKEATEAQRQENADLRSRVSQLQEQIDNMKRLANLKDEQLAALQQQLAAAKGEQPAAEQPAAEQPAGEQPAAAAAPTEPAAPAPEAAAKPALVPATPAPADQPANPYAVKDFKPVDMAALPKETIKQPFKPVVPAAPAQPQPEAVSLVDKAKAMAAEGWSMARANPMISGGVAGVVVLLLFVMALARRRTAASAGFQESILQAPKPAAPEAPAAAAAAGAAATAAATEEEKRVEEAATSYLSDFAVSGMDTLQSETGEADPLTEADVFLAYGRFQPAEAMIEEAIEAEPHRVDLKAKLLEIYHAARNAEAFERQAGVYQADLQSEPDTWEKVADMGRELCPDSPMFRGDVAPAAPTEDEFDFDLHAGSTEGPSDDVLDFDLGEMAPSVDADKPEENLAGDLADELSDIAETMTPERAKSEESDSLEFETVAEPAGAESEAESQVVDAGLLSDVDEVGTKLDLARAYIDMGDPEGARSILDEVMEEGNEAQKGEASELLSQIS
jgi:pilus assembly protein FimV